VSHVRYEMGDGESVMTTPEDARAADFDREMHGMCFFVVTDGIGKRLSPDEWPSQDQLQAHARPELRAKPPVLVVHVADGPGRAVVDIVG